MQYIIANRYYRATNIILRITSTPSAIFPPGSEPLCFGTHLFAMKIPRAWRGQLEYYPSRKIEARVSVTGKYVGFLLGTV